ncbi:MAG: sigma-70 family RNA polymerase sigma factor [Ruminococcaceae bacterium]|nr:sigma-70 family RNA polymerase sigma factor [Oscillospiraceae bacterium]
METSTLYERNQELLRRASEGDSEAEAALVEENLGLVRKVARRFLDRGTEYEDLVQIGTIGMIKAIRSFSPERGTVFSTYAVPLIIGEIRRHLRDEGPIKVSRIYKRQGMMLMCEKNRIAAEEGREAGVAELAARCGVSVEEAAISLDAMSPVTSLSDFVYGEDTVTYENVIPDEESERESERICDRVALTQCIHRLPEMWQKIVLMRYFRNMTQQQTATALGLTQVKISREEKKLLAALREELS